MKKNKSSKKTEAVGEPLASNGNVAASDATFPSPENDLKTNGGANHLPKETKSKHSKKANVMKTNPKKVTETATVDSSGEKENRAASEENTSRSAEPDAELTNAEMELREKLEAIVETHKESFLAVGEALMEINEKRLYRNTHPSFEAYCLEVWEISRPHAYRSIEAFKVVSEMVSNGDPVIPQNESQARVLARFPAEKRKDVMVLAKEKAGGKQITQQHIISVVDEMNHEEPDHAEVEQPSIDGEGTADSKVVPLCSPPITMEQMLDCIKRAAENVKSNIKLEETLQLLEQTRLGLQFMMANVSNENAA